MLRYVRGHKRRQMHWVKPALPCNVTQHAVLLQLPCNLLFLAACTPQPQLYELHVPLLSLPACDPEA